MEPERGAEAHEVRWSAEFSKISKSQKFQRIKNAKNNGINVKLFELLELKSSKNISSVYRRSRDNQYQYMYLLEGLVFKMGVIINFSNVIGQNHGFFDFHIPPILPLTWRHNNTSVKGLFKNAYDAE